MIDIHCHLLYGLDDGAQSPEESMSMLANAQRAGVTGIVATPHVNTIDFDTNLAKQRHQEIAACATCAISLGYEVHIRMLPEIGFYDIAHYADPKTGRLLLELSQSVPPARFERVVYELTSRGMTVCIAHPERYLYLQRDLNQAHLLKQMGCELQVSARSLRNGIFSPVRRCAMRLLQAGIADHIASDAHSPDDYSWFGTVMHTNKYVGGRHGAITF